MSLQDDFTFFSWAKASDPKCDGAPALLTATAKHDP